MNDSGWVKIHKKMTDWEWFTDVNVAHLFVYCLLAANYEPKQWRGVTIERGQFVTSRDRLAEATGLSAQQVRTALDKLERTCEITQKSTNKFRIITVCKYSNYQMVDDSEQPTNNQQITNNQPTNNQQITTTKEYKNIRNKEDNIVDDVGDAHAHTHEEGDGSEVLVKSTEKLWEEYRYILGQESEMSNSTIRYFKSKYNVEVVREDIVAWLDTFQDKNRMEGTEMSNTADYRRHFANWLRIQIEEKIKNQKYEQRIANNRRHPGQERGSTAAITRPGPGDKVSI